MTNIWNFIEAKLSEKKLIYLMVNIMSNGSSPGRQGFSMAVCSDGNLFGSIGGGVMEHRLVEDCKKMLKNDQRHIFVKKQVHKSNVTDGSGMMCSGEQTVAFIPLSQGDIQDISKVASCLSNKKIGIFEITSTHFNFYLSEQNINIQYQCHFENKNNWSYKEVIGYRNTLYIVGAGHVGFAVSKLFSQLGFKIIMLDNRSSLSMLTDNTYADEKLVVNYENIQDYIIESEGNYVVIMTNNHTFDKKVLSRLIRKKVKYLGLMGSKEKVVGLMKSMTEMSFTSEELNKVHSPIGIAINSRTPDEIAISIAAEIISIKNENL